jgi:CBS-domain-containing membrane protein
VRRIAAFGRFWWDFIVGDDWLAAAGVAVALALTAALAAWWVLPVAVAIVLTVSVVRAAQP